MFLFIALTRPQSGSKIKTETNKNSEIIVALDVSNSMLAEDVVPNRLKRAKQIITDLFNKKWKSVNEWLNYTREWTNKGVGLGLPICKKIIDALDGTIRINSVVFQICSSNFKFHFLIR